MSEDEISENEEVNKSENSNEQEQMEYENEEKYDIDECLKNVELEPDNSLQWIKLMKCYTQSGDITSARTTAKKALETINFRKLDEKLNVWKAMLQIESKYGDEKSFNKIYNDAIVECDRKKIMLFVASIYKDNKIYYSPRIIISIK